MDRPTLPFQLAGASVIGQMHREPLKETNGQDGLAYVQSDDVLIAVVCDGCGSGAHSEVGAKLAPRLLINIIQAQLRSHTNRHMAVSDKDQSRFFWDRVHMDFVTKLNLLTQWLGGSYPPNADGEVEFPYRMGMSRSTTVNDFLLFTVVGCLILPEGSLFFSIGDGEIIINGEHIHLTNPRHNTPVYIGYALTGSSLIQDDPRALKFQIQRVMDTDALEFFVLGCDGLEDLMRAEDRCLPATRREETVGPISQLWENDAFFENPYALLNRLRLVNQTVRRGEVRSINPARAKVLTTAGLLPDDTTIIVGRRMPTQGV